MHRRDVHVPHHLVRGPGGEGLNRKLKGNSIVGTEQEQIQNPSLFYVDDIEFNLQRQESRWGRF